MILLNFEILLELLGKLSIEPIKILEDIKINNTIMRFFKNEFNCSTKKMVLLLE